jgi:hypothetical protein
MSDVADEEADARVLRKAPELALDLRNGIACFSGRTKPGFANELPGLPRNWRFILHTAYPSPVVGPRGCLYGSIQYALAAYMAQCTRKPEMFEIFRLDACATIAPRNLAKCCRPGFFSKLGIPFDEALWSVVREMHMYDLLYQRTARDSIYRGIMSVLDEHNIVPLYAVRRPSSRAFWGAKMLERTQSKTADQPEAAKNDVDAVLQGEVDRNFIATHKESTVDVEDARKHLQAASREYHYLEPRILGENRLGKLMLRAYRAYKSCHGDASKTAPQSTEQSAAKKEMPMPLQFTDVASIMYTPLTRTAGLNEASGASSNAPAVREGAARRNDKDLPAFHRALPGRKRPRPSPPPPPKEVAFEAYWDDEIEAMMQDILS